MNGIRKIKLWKLILVLTFPIWIIPGILLMALIITVLSFYEAFKDLWEWMTS